MSHYFIGRQPILDNHLKLHGYELLFRNTEQNSAKFKDGDAATANVMLNAFTEIGLENIVGDKLAYINMTRQFLTNTELLPFTPGRVVLEVLEDIQVDETLVTALEVLLGQGHTIALDDFRHSQNFEPIIDLAQVIKIDVHQMEDGEIESQVEKLRPYDVDLLAEKVETQEQYDKLKALGFKYYQGYFFAKPSIIKGKKVAANKVAVVQLIAKLSNPRTEVGQIQTLIKRDVAMSYRILRIVNSPLTGVRRTIDSIDQAVILLGRQAIKMWATAFALADIEDKPIELMKIALVRARTCEQLASAKSLHGKESFFTVGMFSVLDAMMDMKMEDILKELPLENDILDALLKREGLMGQALNCTLALESQHPEKATFADLEGQTLSEAYLEALSWADQSLGAIRQRP